jgi:hypothetical protein
MCMFQFGRTWNARKVVVDTDLRCVCWEIVMMIRAFMISICEQTRNARQTDKHAI